MAVQTQQPIPIWEILSSMAGITLGAVLGPMFMAGTLGVPGASALGAFILGFSGYGFPGLLHMVRGK